MNPRTYLATVSPTYIENWAAGLYALSIPQVGIVLSREEVGALGRRIRGFEHWFPEGPDEPLQRVAGAIQRALDQFPDGAFIRLGSRSAKDSFHALSRGLRVTNAPDALQMLTGHSQRVAFDLRLALRTGYEPYVFVRKWLDIPPWTEFRCFMNERKLVGISQYDCKNLGHCPEIAANATYIRAAIDAFFTQFRKVSHTDSVVFDVFVATKQNRINAQTAVTLVELNPFFARTDACLFNWSVDGDFDGSFRFLPRPAVH